MAAAGLGTSMSELIATLVDRGLLARHGPGGRGRPVPVTLTDDGHRVLARATSAVRDFNRPATLGLSAAQSALLNDLLHEVIRVRAEP